MNHRVRGAVTMLSLLSLCGCLVPRGPEDTPDLRASRRSGPGTTPAPVSTRGPVATPGTAPVSSFSSALSLAELQALARRRNPSVFEWRARVAAAEARSRQVRSLYFPLLRSDGRYLRLDEEVAFSDPVGNSIVVQDRDTYTQTTLLVYDAFDWGRRHFLHQSALQEGVSSEERRRRALQELDFRAATIYFTVFEARRDLDVARASVESLTGALKLARDLRAVDRATDADVLVVEANLERRRFQARQLEVLIEGLEEDLAHLLDLSPEVEIRLEEPASGAETDEGDPGGVDSSSQYDSAWESLAFARRPELEALNAAHEALENARAAEEATRLPKLGLFLQHQYSTTDSAFSRSDIISGGVSAEWEIFSGFRRSGRIEEIRARSLEVRSQHSAAIHAVQAEVRGARRQWRLAIEGVRVAEKVVDHARENLERVNALFSNGRATGQELLEAESLLRREEAHQNRAGYNVLRAREKLRFSCGLDFDEELKP